MSQPKYYLQIGAGLQICDEGQEPENKNIPTFFIVKNNVSEILSEVVKMIFKLFESAEERYSINYGTFNDGKLYSLNDIKKTFWKTFHESGEVWFDYLNDKESHNNSTEGSWNEFVENLEN